MISPNMNFREIVDSLPQNIFIFVADIQSYVLFQEYKCLNFMRSRFANKACVERVSKKKETIKD